MWIDINNRLFLRNNRLFFWCCAFCFVFWKTDFFINIFSKQFHSRLKSFRKSSLNHSPPYSLKPCILTIGIRAWFLKVIQVDPKIFFLWLENNLLRKVLQSTNHLYFVDWITSIGKLEWKSLWNRLIKEFGIQLRMVLTFQSLERMVLSLQNLCLNGPMMNVKWPSLIVLLKT